METINEMKNLLKPKRSNQATNNLGLIPYCTIDDVFEVMNTLGDNKIVHFEVPDNVYGFKVADIDLEKLFILNREGFNDIEMSKILEFTKNNRELIRRNEVAYYA